MMKTRIGINAIWVTALVVATISQAHGDNYSNLIQNQIEDQLYSYSLAERDHCEPYLQRPADLVLKFYLARDYAPAWTDEAGLKPEASLLINTIENAEESGLSQAAYPIEFIDQLKTNAIDKVAQGEVLSPSLAAQLDIALSTAFFLHSSYLTGGRLKADYFQDIQKLTNTPTQQPMHLEQALATHSFDLLLNKLVPPHKRYLKLISAKKRFERLVAAGGWPQIAAGPVLEKGNHDWRILVLRERLLISGDLSEPLKKDLNYFDKDIENAVKNFQKRHGLYADGIVGPATLKELNVPAEARLMQIMVNLERWRLLPHDLGQRYIEVNIPNYYLTVINQDEIIQSMRVVVGRKSRPTPILSGRIAYVEVNPYWTVPPQIAKKDILPKVQKDPAYLISQKIHVFENWRATASELDPFDIDWSQFGRNYFPYKLRQAPNVRNALGKVKFMFPNKLSIYLHDTPSKELFNRQQRSFSSGCVRVEKPLDLAAYVLGEKNGWNKKRLSSVFEKGLSKVLSLKNPIPVYLLYWTAWVEDDELHFRNDIYGRDHALAQRLDKQLPAFLNCQTHLVSNVLAMSSPTSVSKKTDDRIEKGETMVTENGPLAALSESKE